jgi:pimeloyl-ACP methyl ester carboxylesterase
MKGRPLSGQLVWGRLDRGREGEDFMSGNVCRKSTRLLATAAVLALIAAPAAAHLIVFRDGFVIEGQAKQNTTIVVDTGTKEAVMMPKGHVVIDDGPRRILFSPFQASIVENKAPPVEDQVRCNPGRLAFPGGTPGKMPPVLEILSVTDFSSKFERKIEIRTPPPNSTRRYTQQVAWITPTLVRLDISGATPWEAHYLTREFGPKVVRSLLMEHKDFQEQKKDSPGERAARRFRLAEFLSQVGWYDDAEAELKQIAADMKDQTERVVSAQTTLARLRARDRFEQVKRLRHAGRHEAARQLLTNFPESDLTEQMASTLQEIRADYEQGAERFRDTSRLLAALCKSAGDDTTTDLARAAQRVLLEMDNESSVRLDAFLSQARQAARQRAAGDKPSLSDAELLSLAVSGWLLGSPAAEAKPESALRLWRTREAILTYLRTPDAGDRKKIAEELAKQSRADVLVDEAVQMIPILPPPVPLEDPKPGVIERTVTTRSARTTYHLLLPPEYRHTRAWPVLIVLHREGEKPTEMLARWAESAAENGYILVAPEWETGISGVWGYSEKEHAAVLDTLRDLRNCLQVDSDRVFLSGLSEGGTGAFDVGFAHPDLFAGVLPMGAGPDLFAKMCMRNAQYLPLYIVTGGASGACRGLVREYMDNAILGNFPSIWVDYKGRGIEWFAGEVPTLFDWMRLQKRAFPMQQLGTDGGGGSFGKELCTLRNSNNHFYWLSTDNVLDAHVNHPERWRPRVPPAMLHGRIDPSNNDIFIRTYGVDDVTLWLGRSTGGRSMIDFDRPVTVKVNLAVRMFEKRVRPGLAVLLEDLHDRGDRQQLFLAKLTFSTR